jgi:hypothetical protein
VVDAAKSTMSYTFARREGNIGAAVSHDPDTSRIPVHSPTCPKFQASTVLLNEVFKHIPADAGARTLASLKVCRRVIMHPTVVDLFGHRTLQ